MAYSRITHPERFAALHQIAQALIDRLTTTYDVTVTEGPDSLQDPLRAPDDTIYAVGLIPNSFDTAPLTIVTTAEPAVFVHAGAWCELAFPDWACDVCDQTAVGQAEELEQFVLGVAAGTFRERYPLGRQGAYEYAWAAPDGSSETASTSGPPADSPHTVSTPNTASQHSPTDGDLGHRESPDSTLSGRRRRLATKAPHNPWVMRHRNCETQPRCSVVGCCDGGALDHRRVG